MLRFRLHKRLDTESGSMCLNAEGELPAGESGLICAPSGAGKSTLLKGVAGLIPMEEEQVRFEDACWADSDRGIHRSPRKRPATLLLQEVALFPNMNVERNIRFALPKGADSAKLEEWTERAGLSELRKSYPAALSGGQRQRVGILRALAAQASLLLLDEPFAALDRPNRERMLHLIEEVRSSEGMSVLIASHGPLEAGMELDRSWRLEEGRLVPIRTKGTRSNGSPEHYGGAARKHGKRDSIQGVVLAGGKSRRMGRDKGLMEVNGKPMARHSLDLLRSFTDHRLIVANKAEYRRFGVPVVADLWPEHGPLGGIVTALLATEAERTLVLPCDMPYLNEGVLRELLDRAGPGISIVRHQGAKEPLVGLYPRSFIEHGAAMLDAGLRSVREALDRMGAEWVEEVELRDPPSPFEMDPFENLNHPPLTKT